MKSKLYLRLWYDVFDEFTKVCLYKIRSICFGAVFGRRPLIQVLHFMTQKKDELYKESYEPTEDLLIHFSNKFSQT